MRIAELARETGVSTSALRYYEARGLLRADARTPAGYRVYGCQAVGRVGFIQRAKTLGLSLAEIEALIRERSGPAEELRIRHAIAHKLADTERRLAQLETLRSELLAMQERLKGGNPGCGRVGDCECWLPTDKEARLMAANACSCCGCTCQPDECGGCGCCGCDNSRD